MVATIAKAGIITGMIFAGFMMIMLGIVILPSAINNYDREEVLNQSDEELEKLFTESKEYAAFAERFPDYVAEFNRGTYEVQFQMAALNPETGNALVMEMYYHEYDGPNMDKNIRCDFVVTGGSDRNDSGVTCESGPNDYVVTCESDRNYYQDHASGVLVKLYIENTKCLD